ncbi:hypothetical protein C8J56DRAFT_851619 [Mycena floridula]|nr:hypothetical protein C8J56DRAFT_851619 [Mycena floridula]
MDGSSSSPPDTVRARHRRRRRQPKSSPVPSATLLSLLAPLVPSTSGSPLTFLCPLFSHEPPAVHVEPRSEPAVHLSPKASTRRTRDRRNLPPKYEPGVDGIWRKAETYTLYGSTMCKDCEPTTAAEGAASATGSASANTASATQTPDILDDLPNGWKTKPRENRTTLILALSLVLAFVICFFIIGCLFWRKTVRKKFKDRDVEKRLRRRRSPEDSEELIQVENMVKKKLWSKATARWKAQVRHSARQRRGRRTLSIRLPAVVSNTSISLGTTFDGPEEISFVSRPSSPQLDSIEEPRQTSDDLEEETNDTSVDSVAAPERPSSFPPPPPTPPPLFSPPAYRQRSSLQITASNSPSSGKLLSSLNPSNISSRPCSIHETDSSESLAGSAHAAHVATDDKALLEQLSSLASSPPQQNSNRDSSSHSPMSSAPVWLDEDIEDFVQPESSSQLLNLDGPSASFPPPPSKGKMAEYYDYDFNFGDEHLSSLEPESGLSAPPFEEAHLGMPSAPPMEEEEDIIPLTPSAPSDNEEYPDQHPRLSPEGLRRAS